MLLAVEAYALLTLLSLAAQAWKVPAATATSPVVPADAPHVDVFVCTYDEPLAVVEPTLAGACRLDYPNFTVHLLDDGRRSQMRELARRYGVQWRTRADSSNAKAGNVNAALEAVEQERCGDRDGLLCVLDADHVPDPQLLRATVGYFADSRLALVQVPHEFVNTDSFQHHAHSDAHEQSLLFRILMPGRARSGSVIWSGSGAVLRRRALVEAGGVATGTTAEGFHTTLKLLRRGWTSTFHNQTLVRGIAPDTFEQFLTQRRRWATGTLTAAKTRDSWLFSRSLSLVQRLHFAMTSLGYLAGLQRVALWAVLVAAVWGGVVAAVWPGVWFAVLWASWMATSLLASSALGRGHLKHLPSARWSVLTATSYAGAVVQTLLPAAKRFQSAPKTSGTGSPRELLARTKLPVAVASLLVVGLGVRAAGQLAGVDLLPQLPAGALLMVAVFAGVEITLIISALVPALRRRQMRAAHRVGTELRATITELSAEEQLVVDGRTQGRTSDAPAASSTQLTLVPTSDAGDTRADQRRDGQAALSELNASAPSSMGVAFFDVPRPKAASYQVQLADLTCSGVGLSMYLPHVCEDIEPGSRWTLNFDIPQPDGSEFHVQAPVELVSVRDRRGGRFTHSDRPLLLGGRFVGLDAAARSAIALHIYLKPKQVGSAHRLPFQRPSTGTVWHAGCRPAVAFATSEHEALRAAMAQGTPALFEGDGNGPVGQSGGVSDPGTRPSEEPSDGPAKYGLVRELRELQQLHG